MFDSDVVYWRVLRIIGDDRCLILAGHLCFPCNCRAPVHVRCLSEWHQALLWRQPRMQVGQTTGHDIRQSYVYIYTYIHAYIHTYTTLHYATLHYTTLHYTTWHCMWWHDMTWHDMTWHDMTWHDMTWHDMTWQYILYIPCIHTCDVFEFVLICIIMVLFFNLK